MNKFFILMSILLICSGYIINTKLLYAQEIPASESSITEQLVDNDDETQNNSNKSKNINLDVQALYGPQFNQMISNLNLSQESDTFVFYYSLFVLAPLTSHHPVKILGIIFRCDRIIVITITR